MFDYLKTIFNEAKEKQTMIIKPEQNQDNDLYELVAYYGAGRMILDHYGSFEKKAEALAEFMMMFPMASCDGRMIILNVDSYISGSH